MTSADDIAALAALNARFIANFIANDVAGHDALLHAGFVYINSKGALVGRADYLRGWATGFDPALIPYWDTRDVFISVFGDVALVRAVNKHVEMQDGAPVTGMSAYTDIYLRENGRWLCIQAQITPVAETAWPDDSAIAGIYRNGVLEAGR